MLSVYLIALLVGGFLLAMSMLGGGDHDVDIDVDVDVDVDVDADADADADVDGGSDGFDVMGWFPLASLRFWTFFSAFFGLTGVVLDTGGFTGSYVGLGIAGGVGYICGTTMTRLIRNLRRERVDSSLAADDCIGETARVILPVGPEQTGKVRLELKGRTIELIAETDDSELELGVGQACVIYGLKEDGRAVVTKAAALTD